MFLNKIKYLFFLIALCLSSINLSFAQGDDCAAAFQITNPANYCSGSGFFTNTGSTASGFGVATCQGVSNTEDVWFQFTAIGTDVLISAGGSGSGGTMMSPGISIYNGDCVVGINEQGCANGTGGSGITQLYEGALIQGSNYYIRISTTSNNEGTFELCVNNYTPSANPGADCGGAAFLCNQNPISVATLSGGGANNDEPEASTCLENTFGADEGNSSWFYWTCGTAGTLTFDITPLSPSDDIDFIFYQLGGTNPCGPRAALRCNASACLNANGSTGLSLTDVDLIEDPNCDPWENAYCQFVNMTVGTTYALLVNNFSANMGFTVNFGGTGAFQGPNPNIVALPTSICVGQSVTFNGSTSVNVGGGLTWNFSNGGTPASAIGAGPHVINYNTAGTYTAILNGLDASGCQSTETVTINVNNAPSAPVVTNVTNCQGVPSVALTAVGTNLLWYTNAVGGTGSAIAPIPSTSTVGTSSYFVSQTTNGCEGPRAQIDVIITAPPSMSIPSSIAQCANEMINPSVFSSSQIGVTYAWTNTNTTIGIGANGSGSIPAFTGLNATSIDNIGTISVTPSIGACIGLPVSFTITIYPLPPVNAGIDLSICEGMPVTLNASGGITYNWDNSITDGIPFTPVSTTVYTLTGTSSQGCVNTDQVTVTVNPIPIVSAGGNLIVCEGQTVILTGSGAQTYSWDNGVTNGVAFIPNSAISVYTVTGTSAAGCSSSDQLTLQVIPTPSISFSVDSTIGCSPFNVNFTNSALNSDDCLWNFGDGTQSIGCGSVSHTYIQPGCYDVTLTVTFPSGCLAALTIPSIVCVEPNPIAAFVATPSILNEYDSEASFFNTTIGGSSYYWDFGDSTNGSNLLNPIHDYEAAGLGNFLVTLVAYSPLGCVDSAQRIIQIKEDLLFYVPNTFTPDADEFNSVFSPIFTSGFDPFDFKMLIFDRWGEIIFETNNNEIGWNGTNKSQLGLVQDGIYTWKIEFKTKDNDERQIVVGHVNLIR